MCAHFCHGHDKHVKGDIEGSSKGKKGQTWDWAMEGCNTRNYGVNYGCAVSAYSFSVKSMRMLEGITEGIFRGPNLLEMVYGLRLKSVMSECDLAYSIWFVPCIVQIEFV